MDITKDKTTRLVSIGEMIVSKQPDDALVAYGLGSCVAVILYDPLARVGGMLHALLPAPAGGGQGGRSTPTKFVNSGIPLLIDSIREAGGNPYLAHVYLAGGAQMLRAPGFGNALNIGERNVHTASELLRARGIRVRARSTGGTSGRTVCLDIATGRVVVRSLLQVEELAA